MKEAVADIMRMVDALEAALDTGYPPDTIIVSKWVWEMFRAHHEFGERVNRANRHKFRRVFLRVHQGAYTDDRTT